MPTFPTDNLYKFLTFLGRFVAGWCAYFAHTMERAKEERLLSAILKQIELHQDFAAAIKNAETNYPQLVAELKRRQDQTGMFLEIVKDTRMADKDHVFSISLLKWGTCIGLGIASTGFVLWYLLFQRHVDRLVSLGKIRGD